MNGFGILLLGDVLAHDHETGQPYFASTKRAAQKVLADDLPAWMGATARVVKVERKGATYVVKL